MNDTELNKLFIDWFYWTIECIGDETNNTKFQRVKDNLNSQRRFIKEISSETKKKLVFMNYHYLFYLVL